MYAATSPLASTTANCRPNFVQRALFPSKAHWERYWYSERIAELRIELAGCYQVPILPTYWEVLGAGETVTPAPAAPS